MSVIDGLLMIGLIVAVSVVLTFAFMVADQEQEHEERMKGIEKKEQA